MGSPSHQSTQHVLTAAANTWITRCRFPEISAIEKMDMNKNQLHSGEQGGFKIINIPMDAKVDIHALGFWEPQRAVFFCEGFSP